MTEEEKLYLEQIRTEIADRIYSILESGKGRARTADNISALEEQCAKIVRNQMDSGLLGISDDTIYLNGAPVEALCFLPLVCEDIQERGRYSIICSDGSTAIAEYQGRGLDISNDNVTVGYKVSVQWSEPITEIRGEIVMGE